MSGYRAAPEGESVNQWNNPTQRFERRGRCIAAVGGKSICVVMGSGGEGRAEAIVEMINERLDARLTALDSAAAACEAIGDARGAEAVRRLKEQA